MDGKSSGVSAIITLVFSVFRSFLIQSFATCILDICSLLTEILTWIVSRKTVGQSQVELTNYTSADLGVHVVASGSPKELLSQSKEIERHARCAISLMGNTYVIHEATSTAGVQPIFNSVTLTNLLALLRCGTMGMWFPSCPKMKLKSPTDTYNFNNLILFSIQSNSFSYFNQSNSFS